MADVEYQNLTTIQTAHEEHEECDSGSDTSEYREFMWVLSNGGFFPNKPMHDSNVGSCFDIGLSILLK